jgi:hypothetical protein
MHESQQTSGMMTATAERSGGPHHSKAEMHESQQTSMHESQQTSGMKTATAERSGDVHHSKAETAERSGNFGKSACEDVSGWYDVDGAEFDCAYYEENGVCSDWGDSYANLGHTGNTACCACGGGCSSVSGWHDVDGAQFDCAYYEENDVCSSWGDSYANLGHTGNTACCACGGGTSGGGSSCPSNAVVPYGADPNPNYTGPGFKIKNDTPWFVEVSLWQVSFFVSLSPISVISNL